MKKHNSVESICKTFASKKERRKLYLFLIELFQREKGEDEGSDIFVCSEVIHALTKKNDFDIYQIKLSIEKVIPEYFLFDDAKEVEDFYRNIWFNNTYQKHFGFGDIYNNDENKMRYNINDMRLSALMFCAEMCK